MNDIEESQDYFVDNERKPRSMSQKPAATLGSGFRSQENYNDEDGEIQQNFSAQGINEEMVDTENQSRIIVR